MKKPEYLRGEVFRVFLFFIVLFFDTLLISVRNRRFVFLSLCRPSSILVVVIGICVEHSGHLGFLLFLVDFVFDSVPFHFGPKSSICLPLALSSESDSGGGDRYICRTLRPFRVLIFLVEFVCRFVRPIESNDGFHSFRFGDGFR